MSKQKPSPSPAEVGSTREASPSPRRQRKEGTSKSHRDREIARLRRELEQERRHSAALERELAAIKQELRDAEDADRDRPWRQLNRRRKLDERTRAEEQLREGASRRAHHYRKGSFWRYSFESVTDSLPVRILTQLWAYFKRIRVVQVVLTLIPAVGAVVLVTVLSAAALPFFLIGSGTLALIGWLRSRRMNRIMTEALAGRHIRVFIPPRGDASKRIFRRVGRKSRRARAASSEPFFWRQAQAMAAEEGVAVLVVSPYVLSDRGMGGRGAFFTARKETEGVYLVRRHYFFILRRRVLDAVDAQITAIY